MLRLYHDGTPADWIKPYVVAAGDRFEVQTLVPSIYERYVRVLHPATRVLDPDTEVEVAWREIADEAGIALNGTVDWSDLATSLDEATVASIYPPEEGSLPKRQAAVLAGILASDASLTETVWFCVWEGWGDLTIAPQPVTLLRRDRFPWTRRRTTRQRPHQGAVPQVDFPLRSYHLFSGTLRDATESYSSAWRSANMWWPDDRAWFVATEIDACSTLIGCNAATGATILSSPELESYPVRPDDPIL